MSVTFDGRDLTELDRALEFYAAATGKDMEDVCNRTSMNVAYRSAQLTVKADRAKLMTMLGQSAKGKAKKGGSRFKVTTAASAILAKRMRKGGAKTLPPQPTWDLLVAAFIKKTITSIAFIKSGWLPAAKVFERLYRGPRGINVSKSEAFGRTDPDISTVNPYPQIGEGIGARAVGGVITAELANQSVNPRNKTSEWALEHFGGSGLDKAIAFVAQDMTDYAQERMDKQAGVFNKDTV
jgi:hypothetical protein